MLVQPLRALATALLCIAISACGSGDLGASRLNDIPIGATREAALDELGTGPLTATGADTLRLAHGFRRQMFLSNGKTYEVIYYRETPGSLSDAIVRETETPLVLEGGKVIGHGWEFYTALAQRESLPNPLNEQRVRDSIANAAKTK